MTTLIFFGTIIAIIILLVRLVIKVFNHKNSSSTLWKLLFTIVSYTALWCVFYFISSDKIVPFGTDICFDDWCATVTKYERRITLGKENQEINPHIQYIILNIKMSNKSRGIAQKPSEPRVHIIDENGNFYPFSTEGQHELEKQIGKQIPIYEKLELNQSLETQLVFEIPKEAKNLKVLIEEGPFITKFLFKENNEVFLIP